MTESENMTEHLMVVRDSLLGGSDPWTFTEAQQRNIQRSVAQLVHAYETLVRTVILAGGKPEAETLPEAELEWSGDWGDATEPE